VPGSPPWHWFAGLTGAQLGGMTLMLPFRSGADWLVPR
jgi:hypothetical protein